MITDKDVKKLKEVFATKNELEKLDARTAAGFLDVQEQLNGIKQDVSGLKQDIGGLKQDVSDLKQDVSDLKQDVSDLKQDVSEIKNNMLTMEDNIVGAIHNLQIENSVTATYRPKIEDHEKRISKLEKLQYAN